MNTRDPSCKSLLIPAYGSSRTTPNLVTYGDFTTSEEGGGGGGCKSAKTSAINAPVLRSFSVTMQVPWTICEQGLPLPQGEAGNRSSQGRDGEGQATCFLTGYQLEFDRSGRGLPASARRRFCALLDACRRVLGRGRK